MLIMPRGGNGGVGAPEEVVTSFERRGDFEGGDVAALRVDAGEDVADGAVLAGGVHALQDDEERLLLARRRRPPADVDELLAVLLEEVVGGVVGS